MLIDVSAVLMCSLLCFVALHYTVHITYAHPQSIQDSFFPTVSTYAFFCSTFLCSSTFFSSSICSTFNCYSLRILSLMCLSSYSALFCATPPAHILWLLIPSLILPSFLLSSLKNTFALLSPGLLLSLIFILFPTLPKEPLSISYCSKSHI